MTVYACPFRVCGDGTLCDNGKPRRKTGTMAEYECMAWSDMGCGLVCPINRVIRVD